MSSRLPGLLLVSVIAAAATAGHRLLPADSAWLLAPVILALVFGVLTRNLLSLPPISRPGIQFSLRTLLPAAIVLLGAGFTLSRVVDIGAKSLAMVIVLMLVAMSTVYALAHRLKIRWKLATLIAVGTAVCGNTAVVATARVVQAEDEDISFAVASNTCLGTLAVLLYPVLGYLLNFSDAAFGTWAGSAVNDTSQVLATGFAFSNSAGEVATTVKLTRNALLGFVVMIMGLLYARRARVEHVRIPWPRRMRHSIPPFVIGFMLMALLNTVGALEVVSSFTGVDVLYVLAGIAHILIVLAMAAIGLETDISALRRIGFRPFLVALAGTASLSLSSLLLIRLLGPAG